MSDNRYYVKLEKMAVDASYSLAVRIPKVIVEQAHIAEGEELEITVEGARIALEPINAKLSLETLVDAITPENVHGELD